MFQVIQVVGLKNRSESKKTLSSRVETINQQHLCRTWLLSYIYSETVVTSEPARTFHNAEPRWSGGLSVYVDALY